MNSANTTSATPPAQHTLVEKKKGGQGLVLRRRADRQMRQEGIDLDRAHRFRMTLAMKNDEPTNPRYIGGLRS
jgi:hypothetical protein